MVPTPSNESAAGGVPPPLRLAGAGPRAVEGLLIEELERALPATDAGLGALAAPVRIVVPSGALRSHLIARLARRRPAWLGLEVVTLRAVALTIVERAGGEPPRGAALLPLLTRRAALQEPALARPLEPLEGGFAPLVGTVRDLLDAGLSSEHVPALLELLVSEDVALGRDERGRSAAVVRVAGSVADELERAARDVGAALYRHAAERLAERPDLAPPCARLLLHGFVDATGAVAELLQALARSLPTTLLFDLPRTATDSSREPLGEPFGAALRDRLAPGWRPERVAEAPRPELDAFSALGETGEALEVARRVRAALAEGVAPESVAVVARDLARHLPALRRAFEESAIPFSVEGAAVAPAELRDALALVRLLDEREATRAETVFDLLAPGLAEVAPAAELRLAARVLGATTLGELAAIDLATHLGEASSLALPLRGLHDEGEGGDAPIRARSRRLARAAVARLLGECRRLARAIEALPQRDAVRVHCGALGALARSTLPLEGAAGLWLAGALARLASDLPSEMVVGRDEIADLLARAAEGIEAIRPGGVGGGVQLLSVVAARARTFERLFLIGLNRGEFPTDAQEDPLLGDASRRAMRSLLPDLPVPGDVLFEDRFLFDQLIDAAPRVTLSFASRADDASVRLVSPLLDRLSWRDDGTLRLRERWQRPVAEGGPDRDGPLRSARRRALAAGLEGDRARWREWLAAAIAERGGAACVGRADRALAAALAATVDEIDPDWRTPVGAAIWRRLGPFFGRIGAGAFRRDRLYVTRVEQALACGWKTLLERGLSLEPLADPSLDLPAPLDARLIGTGSHRVLERLFSIEATEGGATLAARLEAPARPLPFPSAESIAAAAHEAAVTILAEEGLASWGFERLLAASIAGAVANASVDWESEAVEVLGVEVDGEADLAPWGLAETLRFRVDRVDRWQGAPRLTDYKSWSPEGLKRRLAGGRWADAARRGLHLQPVAYVAALAGAPARGRFLALGDDDPESRAPRVAEIDESGEAELAALAEATRRAVAALDAGRLPPRLVDPGGFETGPTCRYCEVAEACLQGDSGARRRLRQWTEDRRAHGPESSAAGDRAEAELVLAHHPEEDAP